jgi:hypothetical protein
LLARCAFSFEPVCDRPRRLRIPSLRLHFVKEPRTFRFPPAPSLSLRHRPVQRGGRFIIIRRPGVNIFFFSPFRFLSRSFPRSSSLSPPRRFSGCRRVGRPGFRGPTGPRQTLFSPPRTFIRSAGAPYSPVAHPTKSMGRTKFQNMPITAPLQDR